MLYTIKLVRTQEAITQTDPDSPTDSPTLGGVPHLDLLFSITLFVQ